MASKFQNRLVGTIILVALGIIILPGLLDGKKKHHQEKFAAIPLVPGSGDQQDHEIIPPVTHSLPEKPEDQEKAATLVNSGEPTSGPAAQPGATAQNGQQSVQITEPPSAQQKTQPSSSANRVTEAPSKPANSEKKAEPTPPVAKAYVVQLGALKNAARVDEVIARLRLSGYQVYTQPSTPVQGQLTRIYVGPDISQAKMQAAIEELHQLSGLQGVVRPYSIR